MYFSVALRAEHGLARPPLHVLFRMRVLLNFSALIFVLQKAKTTECTIKQAIFRRKIEKYLISKSCNETKSEVEFYINCVGDESSLQSFWNICVGLCELNSKH
jgi:hypothetical protein